MEILSTYNDKGGVGKTTTSLILGEALASAGYSVLMIDNDPQGSLSVDSLGCNRSSPGMDQVYSGQKEIGDSIYPTHVERMLVVPCGPALKANTALLEGQKKLEKRVLQVFENLRTEQDDYFDYVIIDNPPDDTGHPKYCSMHADKIVIPVIPDEVCFSALLRTHTSLSQTFPNWSKQKVYVVPTLVMENRKLHEKYYEAIRRFVQAGTKSHAELNPGSKYNTVITSTFIPNVAEIPEIVAGKKNLFISKASTKAAKVGRQIVLEIFEDIPAEEFNKYIDELIEKAKRTNIENLLKGALERRNATTKSPEDVAAEKMKAEALNG